MFHGNILDGVRAAARLGFDGIEIFPPSPDAVPTSELSSILSDSGLGVAAIGTGAGWLIERLSLADPDRIRRSQAVDFVRRMIDRAAAWKAPAIIGSMQGRSSSDGRVDQSRGWLRESLEILDGHAQANRGNILYEPLNRYETDQCNTLAEGLGMIRDLQRTRLLADWFHMNIEESDMQAAIAQAGSAIGHVHFADSNRRAVGMGHLDARSLVRTLQQIGYAGYLSAEVFPHPSSEVAAQRTADSFQRLLTSISEQDT